MFVASQFLKYNIEQDIKIIYRTILTSRIKTNIQNLNFDLNLIIIKPALTNYPFMQVL